jgi:hypothetical protein
MSSFVYNVKVNAMQSAINTAIKDTILKLSKKYEFDPDEAFAFLGVEEKLRVNIGAKAKPLRAPKREQPKFPLPFSGEQIEDCCIAILPNKGLYSQCLNAPASNGLCSSCFKKANNTPFGKPEYGTIDERIEQGDEYKDPKGKKPTHFIQIMKKMNLTEEFVLGEVTKYNLPFDTNHFLEPEQTKRGRPNKKEQTETTKVIRAKKATNIVEVALNDNEEDLVQIMIQDQEMGDTPAPVQAPATPPSSPACPPPSSPASPPPSSPATPPSAPATPPPATPPAPANPLKLSLQFPNSSSSSQENEENISDITESPKIVVKKPTQKKAQKEAEKEAKKQEKAQKEAEKEAKKQEKARKEAEKEAKKQEKAKKEAKKEAEEKAKKEAEEKAKKEAEEKAKKEADKVESDELSVENIEDELPATTKAKVKVMYVTYNGVKYLVKEEDNTAWREDTSEYAGYWLPKEKIIVFEEDEEEEDEDEDDEEELVEDSEEEK